MAGLGVVLVALGLVLGCSGSLLGDLGSVLGGLEAILGLSWGAFGRSWGILGRSLGHLGAVLALLGRFWGGREMKKTLIFLWFFNTFCVLRGAKLVLFWFFFRIIFCIDFWSILGSILGPCWAHFGNQNWSFWGPIFGRFLAVDPRAP